MQATGRHAGERAGACWARRQAQGRWAGRAWGVGLACVGRWAGVRGARQAGSAAGARGRQGAAGVARGRQVRGRRRQAQRGRAGACGWAHRARGARPAWVWPGRWMGAQAGPAGPVLVYCGPGSVLARFLDPVRLGIFLSHQMNIVHCKINFFSKKKKYLLNSNKMN